MTAKLLPSCQAAQCAEGPRAAPHLTQTRDGTPELGPCEQMASLGNGNEWLSLETEGIRVLRVWMAEAPSLQNY